MSRDNNPNQETKGNILGTGLATTGLIGANSGSDNLSVKPNPNESVKEKSNDGEGSGNEDQDITSFTPEIGLTNLMEKAWEIESNSQDPMLLKKSIRRHKHSLKALDNADDISLAEKEDDLKESQWMIENVNKKNEGKLRIEAYINSEHKKSQHKIVDEDSGKTIHAIESSLPNYITSDEDRAQYKKGFERVIGSRESVANDSTYYGYVPGASELHEPAQYNKEAANEQAQVSARTSFDSMRYSSNSEFNGNDSTSENDSLVQEPTSLESKGTKRIREEEKDEQSSNKKAKKDNDDDEPKGSGLSGSGPVTGSDNLGVDSGGPSNFRTNFVDSLLLSISTIFSIISEFFNYF